MRIICISLFLSVSVFANSVNTLCISCHKAENISSRMIYKRYLMHYSSHERIAEAMKIYLKNPDPKKTVLAKQFSKEKSIKKPTDLSNIELEKAIEAYIHRYDMYKRLKLADENASLE